MIASLLYSFSFDGVFNTNLIVDSCSVLKYLDTLTNAPPFPVTDTMFFLKEEIAVLSAIYHTLKLGFGMIANKKTQALSHRSSTATASENAQNRKHNDSEHWSLDGLQLRVQPRWASPLDICLNKNGAMIPFRSLFDDALLSSEMGHTESSARELTHSKTKTSSLAALNSSLYDGGAMESFSSSFPAGLLCPDAESTSTTSAAAEDFQSPVTDEFISSGSDGRASPTSSIYSSELSSGVSNSLHHSRKSSLATSIDFPRETDLSQLSANRTNEFAEASNPCEDLGLYSEAQHHHHHIKVALPTMQNAVSSHTAAGEDSVQDVFHSMNHKEELSGEPLDEVLDIEDPGLESLGEGRAANTADDCLVTAGEEASHLIEESSMLDESSIYQDICGASAPASAEEATAWAHSHCPVNPHGTKIKILTDQQGREFVLYHDCYHCLPIQLCPEYAGELDEHDEDTAEREDPNQGGED